MDEKLKALIEKRNAKAAELKAITDKAVEEQRAISEEEESNFKAIEAEVRALDDTIAKAKDAIDPLVLVEERSEEKPEDEKPEDAETRAFANYIRGIVEERADQNLTMGENGAIVPKTIAAQVMKKVKDRAPLYAWAQKYNVKGTLELPYYDESAGQITVAWANEFEELESTSGKFGAIELTGYLAGTLTKISRSLLNSNDFDLVSFVVADMAEKIADFIEAQIISSTKIEGLKGVKIVKTAAAATAVAVDEIIEFKDSVKDAFQGGCKWLMHPETRTELRKLKDGNGRYLMQDDVTSAFGSVLLGKEIYVSDAMPKLEAGKTAIYYGDFTGLAIKMVETPEIQMLMEKFATQHAIGAVAWLEFDCKVQNAQKIAALKMKTA